MQRLLLPLLAILALAAADVACTAEPDAGIPRKSGTSKNKNKGTENSADPDDGTTDDTTGGDDTTTPGTTTSDGGTGDGGGPVAKPTSKGTGGPTGANTLTSTGGLKYMLKAPAPAKATGLLVLLHGSGASNYAQFVNTMATVATQQNLLPVSVLAPNGQGWNEGNQTNAAELLHQLIQQDLLPKYDIELTRVVFSGQSSGGGFLSTHFLPAHAKDYRGGAFMQCGAAKPVLALAPDAATKAGFKLHFEITTGDTIWPASYKESVAAYGAAGMSLTKDDTKAGGHCQFDQQAVIQAHIATILPPP